MFKLPAFASISSLTEHTGHSENQGERNKIKQEFKFKEATGNWSWSNNLFTIVSIVR